MAAEDFADQVANMADLSDDELAQLESDIVAAFDAADEASDIDEMQALADLLDQVRAEISSRSGEGETADDAGAPPVEDAADAPVAAAVETETPAPVANEVPAPTPSDDAPAEEESDEDETPEVQINSTTPESEAQVVAEITAEDVPSENAPIAAGAAPVTIRAGGDIPGITAGSTLEDMDSVVEAITRKVNAMRGVSGNGEQIIVASIQNPEANEDHILRAGDLEGNSRKIRSLISDPEALTPEALTAGAWCAPRTPIYEVPTVGTTERPVQQGLPTFRADRGGVTWVQPPTLPGFEGATSLWRFDGSDWTAYTDPEGKVEASPNDEKPCLKVECGAEQSVDVDAVPFCLTFDNLTARAFPEWVRATTELTMVAQARFAEQKSLSQLFSLAATGSAGTISNTIGVARDFFVGVLLAAAAKRHEHRMAPDSPLQLLAPQWLAKAIAIELGIGKDFDVHAASEVDAYLKQENLTPIWYIDDVPGKPAFTSQSAFPNKAHWMLFPTGTYVRLDNGELNLGVVRTKEDVKKNQYTEFSETFETVAHMGPAGFGWTVQGVTTVALLSNYTSS